MTDHRHDGRFTFIGPTRPGPAQRTDGPVIVSLTEFTAHRVRDLPGIAREGIGLAKGWWAMPGAISVALYVNPARKRGGSLSVWETDADLKRFIALPRHVAIMRKYRHRVSVRAATWSTVNFNIQDAWAQRKERLDANTPR